MKKQRTALGAYVFAGAWTLGTQKHFKVLAHFEEGEFGVPTARHNLPGLDIYTDMPNWPVSDYAGRVDYLYANPPCAPWSVAASGVGVPDWRNNPLTSCWRRTADLVFQLQPKVAHIESVRGIYTKGREMIEQIAQEARKNGYQAIALLENARDCNLPQQRPRFVLCLTKYQYLASPTHGKEVTAGECLEKFWKLKRVSEANKRIPEPKNFFKTVEGKLIKRAKPGERLCRVFDAMYPDAKPVDGKIKGRVSFLKYRIHPDEPSPTQLGGAMLFHPKEHRYLTIGEAAALCGYPADFEFVGSLSAAYAQMGKAVLPPVGAHLARDALATIRAHKKLKDLAPVEITIGRTETSSRPIDLTPQKNVPIRGIKSSNPVKPPSSGSRNPPCPAPRASPLAVRAPRAGIGAYIRELLTGGVAEARIVALVHRKFPTSRATLADVKWNRGHMQNPGGKFYGIQHTARTK